MRKNHHKLEIALVSLISVFASAPAYAYLDPGTGMAIIQGIIAAVAGAIVITRLYWYRLLRLLGLKKDAPEGKQEAARGDNPG